MKIKTLGHSILFILCHCVSLFLIEYQQNSLQADSLKIFDNINKTQIGSSIQNPCYYNGAIYFSANDSEHGQELWKSNGSYDTTVILKDINPGFHGSKPSSLVISGGYLYFVADDGEHGNEIWRTDGTETGTVLVKDIRTGSDSSFPSNLTNFNNQLYFYCNDGTHGTEVWSTSGTSNTTSILKDINPGAPGTWTSNICVYSNKIYFSSNDGTNGVELWCSDGTTNGTNLVYDINTNGNSLPSYLTSDGNYLYFAANDGVNGIELWRTYQTPSGGHQTVLVKDINQTSGAPSNPNRLTFFKNKLYFSAEDGSNRYKLWTSDGTSGGTKLVTNLYSGNSYLHPANLIATSNYLFFSAYSPQHGEELYIYDGTNSPQILKDIMPGSSSSSINHIFKAANNTIFFTANDGINGIELWETDGTTANTQLIKDIYPGATGSYPDKFCQIGTGQILFTADNGTDGKELWGTSGTAASTLPIRKISLSDKSSLYELYATGDMLFLSANDENSGIELWTPDNQDSAINILKDIYPGSNKSHPSFLGELAGKVYFCANNGVDGRELWKSDGTENGTVMVKDIYKGANTSAIPKSFITYGDIVLFSANDGTHGNELWKSDGTENGTVMVKNISQGSFSSQVNSFSECNGYIYFSAREFTHGTELWKSDGTENGTVMVKNISQGSISSYPKYMTPLNDLLFFIANNGSDGFELWSSDGSESGTKIIKDINHGSSSSNIKSITTMNGFLYFFANDGQHGFELWKSDGTEDGTVLIKDIYTGLTSSIHQSISEMLSVNGILYFSANNGTNGFELWRSDGTTNGTFMLKDILPGSEGSRPVNFHKDGNYFYFVAYDDIHGMELWKSDGTKNGTVTAKEIISGIASPNIKDIVNYKKNIVIQIDDQVHGYEPWLYKPSWITSVSPQSGSTSEKTQVIISGINLGNGQDITAVSINGTNATIIAQDENSVTVETGPSSSGIGDVEVISTTFGTTVSKNAFIYSDKPLISITPDIQYLMENKNTAKVTFSIPEQVESNINIHLKYSGSAGRGTDFATSDTLVIKAGELSGELTVTSVSDSLMEGDESIVISIDSATNASFLPQNNAKVIITDNNDNVCLVQYLSEDNGYLVGNKLQHIFKSQNSKQVEAVPDTGYHFKQWDDGITDNPRTDSNVQNDITATAQFEINTYNLHYSVGTGGSISGDTEQHVPYQSDGSAVNALPDSGYHFVQWSDGVTDNPRTDLNITSDIDAEAQFTLNPTYSLTVINGTGTGYIIEGTTADITADSPPEGSHFTNWTSSGSGTFDNPNEITTAFTMPGEDVTVTANYELNSYSLEYIAGGHGTINGNSAQIVLYGNDGTQVEAVPETGYHFTQWDDGITDNQRIDSNVQNDIKVAAQFEINTYNLHYSVGTGGALSGDTEQHVTYQSDGTAVNALPDSGYHFVQWSDGITDNPRTDLNIASNIDVEAQFDFNPVYKLTVINGSGSGDIIEGTTVNLTADSPPEGSHFSSWTSSGGGTFDNPDETTAVFTMPGENVTVTANYELNLYSLQYTAESHGTINGTTSQAVRYGNDGTPVEAVPETGYHFMQWDDGITDNPRTDSNIQNDITITAQFEINIYNLHYSAGEGGFILGEPDKTVNYSEDGQPVAAVPDKGYVFTGWDDGIKDNPRQDIQITADIQVQAEFQPEEYTVTFDLGEHGTRLSGGALIQNISYNSSAVSPDFETEEGWIFMGWDNDFSNITENITIHALYEGASFSVTGTINGLSHENVVLYTGEKHIAFSDKDGKFTLNKLTRGNYKLTPVKTGFTFSPPFINIDITNSNIENITFSIESPKSLYTLSGTINGQSTNNIRIILISSDNSQRITYSDANGNFRYMQLPDGIYTLMPESDDLNFSPSQIELEIDNADVTDISFTAKNKPINLPPVAVDDQYSLSSNSTLTAKKGVIENDYDPEGNSLTVTILKDVSHGVLDLDADGSFIFTPDQNFYGSDSFTYSLNDGINTSEANVLLTVIPKNFTIGMLVSISSSEVEKFTANSRFDVYPKIYGIAPDGKRFSLKKYKSSFTPEKVTGVWSAKTSLFDRKLFKHDFGKIVREISKAQRAKEVQFMIKFKNKNGEKIESKAGTALLTSPLIKEIEGFSRPGATLTLRGKYFGNKPPKVYLFSSLGNDILKLKVLKNFEFKDFKGKPSCMDSASGKSSCQILMPGNSKLNIGTEYYLILDNKIGIALDSDRKIPIIIIK